MTDTEVMEQIKDIYWEGKRDHRLTYSKLAREIGFKTPFVLINAIGGRFVTPATIEKIRVFLEKKQPCQSL
jgi:hypothetical protein